MIRQRQVPKRLVAHILRDDARNGPLTEEKEMEKDKPANRRIEPGDDQDQTHFPVRRNQRSTMMTMMSPDIQKLAGCDMIPRVLSEVAKRKVQVLVTIPVELGVHCRRR